MLKYTKGYIIIFHSLLMLQLLSSCWFSGSSGARWINAAAAGELTDSLKVLLVIVVVLKNYMIFFKTFGQL